MSGVESRVNKRFERAREYITQFINNPIPKELGESDRNTVDQNVDNIRRFLNGDRKLSGSESAIPPFE